MNEFRADLHSHSTCSDGTLPPDELVRLAKKIGLRGLSITDHDTIDAYKIAMPAAKELGIEIISGVEFSSMLDDVSVHILAYAFSLECPGIQSFCQEHNVRREKRNREILALLAKKGMPVAEEDIISSVPHTVGRPHIAQAMVNKGYVATIQEAFKKYLGEGKPCYASGDSFNPKETIEIIHQAGGAAIIAHPHLIEDSDTLLKLLKMPFDGIECYYSRFPAGDNMRWLKIAERKGWLITGGSDFHGDVKPGLPLGCSWVSEEHFRKLQKRDLFRNE